MGTGTFLTVTQGILTKFACYPLVYWELMAVAYAVWSGTREPHVAACI